MKGPGWVFLGVLAVIVLIASLPEIRRYGKVRQM